jgi:hypothetical protein
MNNSQKGIINKRSSSHKLTLKYSIRGLNSSDALLPSDPALKGKL